MAFLESKPDSRTTGGDADGGAMPPTRRSCWTVFLLFFAIALAWALYTQHVWEDFYITYRASKNLATGHGLTFTVGERVHSFTSPLGVLLPALASLIVGNTSDTAALWIFRLMSIASYAGTGVMLWRLGRSLFSRVYPAVFLVLLLATDAKTIDFATNGMETPFVLLFLSWTLYALFHFPPRSAVHLGISWAGLMWSRPDSFVYIGALAAGALLFLRAKPFWGERWRRLKVFLVAGGITAALYLPWVLWAWWYYGSPVPHTVIAKGLLLPKVTPVEVLRWVADFPFNIARTGAGLATTFMPSYGVTTGWAGWAVQSSFYLSLAVMLVWLVPLVRWEARVASLAFMVGHFYLKYFAKFHSPWYVPTLTLLAMIVLAGIVGDLARQSSTAGRGRAGRYLAMAVIFLVPLGALALTVCASHQLRVAQSIIETGNRRAIGEWLKANASSPRDTVFLECLGYIGFFSNLKMYDYPGLCSPEVVALRRKSITRGDYVHYFPELITGLEPDWVVLRGYEVRQLRLIDRDVLSRYYSLARVFNVRDQIDAVKFLPGRSYLRFDARFEVYRRNRGPAGSAVRIPMISVPITADSLIARQTRTGPAFDSNGHLMAYGPAYLTVKIPPGARTITGQFGFFPSSDEKAHASTPGATFTINVVSASGEKIPIYHAELNPRDRLQDRGDQSFTASIPAGDGPIAELVITPPPEAGNPICPTYWTNLKFEMPKL